MPWWNPVPDITRPLHTCFSLGACRQAFSALLGALGQQRVTLGDKQHVALGIGVAHCQSNVGRFPLQLPPLRHPSCSERRIVPIISRHCPKVPLPAALHCQKNVGPGVGFPRIVCYRTNIADFGRTGWAILGLP